MKEDFTLNLKASPKQLKDLIGKHGIKRMVWYAEEAQKRGCPEFFWEEITLPLWLYEMVPGPDQHKYKFYFDNLD
jgi:hypothetical protein